MIARFSYCEHSVVPEIPRVQDVFYALRLSDKQECYEFCLCNHSTYVRNTHLVAADVADEVLNMEPCYDEQEARRVVARRILDMAPDEAKTRHNDAIEQAIQIAGA